MKFMVMHRHDKNTEAGLLPPAELIARMGALIGGMAQSGRLLDGEGLGASKTRTRVAVRGGRAAVEHGPYTGTHELPATVAKIKVGSRDEAVALATEMARAIGGDVELEVGKINEPWDLGFGARPPDAPERYLLVHKATPATEAGHLPDLAAVTAAAAARGALIGTIALAPSARATRLVWKGGRRTVIDGPFTETKELIGGYALLEMASLDECVAFSSQYADILLSVADQLEIDIRPLA